jgi:hypothetical protein
MFRFRCCCYTGGKVGSGGKRGSVVYPNVRHTIVVRRRREGGMKEFAEGVVRGEEGWGCGGCGIM